jgi:glyoxalase family protein
MEPSAGLHHVTAITGDARGNLDFYTRVLGMRLVKRTVNQDDVSAYHLFYADAVGSPGTDLTFFDWPDTPINVPGAPGIAPVALRIDSEEALEWWRNEFERRGVPHSQAGGSEGSLRLAFSDPEGQRLELVPDGGIPGGRPWSGSPVPPEFRVKGLYGVTITSLRPEATAALLTQGMGFRLGSQRELADGGTEYSYVTGSGGPGTEVRLNVPERVTPAQQGRGGVHHVAFRVLDAAAQEEWREQMAVLGLRPTPVIDRYYFKSVYFREPGGVLFEIATDGPGFTADEAADHLGEGLALPPFLEAQRERIEAGLVPLA